jgi:8-oxo-dGTP diphosphatase
MDGGAPQPASVPERKPDLTVVAALIFRDSRILICQRRRNDSHGLQWEFPGGKVEAGESLEEALRRELREELGIEATVGKEIYRTRHRYREFLSELELIFLLASVSPSAPMQNLVFERFEWAEVTTLPEYDFLQADKEFVKLLASGAIPVDTSK